MLAGAVALMGSVFVGSAHAGGPVVNNANDTVTCGTISKGVIKPKPTLNNTGGVPTVIAVSGAVSDCVSSNASITGLTGTFKGAINSADNGCAGLAGPSTSSGSITITWKAGQSLSNKSTTVAIASGSAVGGFASVGGGTHGTFTLGAPEGTALSATGGFTGGDGGAASHTSLVTQESLGSILGACGGVKGLGVINIGVGGLNIG